MMYKCNSCGHLFEEGEQAVHTETHGFNDGYAEHFYVCPVCSGDYEEVHQCKKCGDWHTEDEFYDGWCESCLRESINYDSFFNYCEDNRRENYLDIFVMSELMGGMNCPSNVSYEFHQLMIDTYLRAVANAKLLPQTDFIDRCIRFVIEDDGSIGCENYADWLNKRGVK